MRKDKEKKKEDTIKEIKKPAPKGRGSLNEIERQLAECQKLRDEYLNSWKKERASFLNYKKEESERISGLMKFANEELILKILPVLDNIYFAEKKLPKELKSNQWVEGILKIKTQILDFLKSQGVEEIKCLGEKFDPNFQEAVEEVEPAFAKASVGKSGIVIEEIKKGYKLHNKIIRPAKVKISK